MPAHGGDDESVWPWLLGGLALLLGYISLNVLVMRAGRQDWSLGAVTSYSPAIEPARRPRATAQRTEPIEAPRQPRRHLVELLASRDPAFSLVLFEDFLYALFTTYHEARGGSAKHDVSPYVKEAAERFLEEGQRDDVRNVIVGAMEITNARDVGNYVAVEVSFEANYEEVHDGTTRAFYTLEKWIVQRAENTKSRVPERAAIDTCPNCGGALEDADGNVCSYCQHALTPGVFDWAVTHIEAERQTRGPMLVGDVPEMGTELPTVIIDGARQRFAELARRDATFSWPAFQQRISVIFAALHEGWTARDEAKVRPYVSDQLFQAQRYWIEEYKRQKLNNRTDGARIVDVQMSNVESDAVYDAITVRLFATGKDYTVDEQGKLVSGSKTFDRQYTEYWTLIRGRSVRGAAQSDPCCPNCGATIAVNMAGACEHCQVKITRGDFDWVLSRIEQDEAYG